MGCFTGNRRNKQKKYKSKFFQGSKLALSYKKDRLAGNSLLFGFISLLIGVTKVFFGPLFAYFCISMYRLAYIFLLSFLVTRTSAQLLIARDTITVIENGRVLKMPWANGINFTNASSLDLNGDGKKDIVLFDRLNQYSIGRFRCFLNTGSAGQIKYKEDTYSPYFFPEVANWAVFRDYNCDGKEDLFCSTSAGIKVYKNVSSVSTGLKFELFKALLYSDFNPNGTPSIGNLYASTVGVPGIEDIDGDGDLDILTFSPQGVLIELHENIRTNCDSLIFRLSTDCWGGISESNCEVSFQACGQKAERNDQTDATPVQKTYHAGSCLTCLDSDGDGDQDLIMGDVSCTNLQYVHNNGTNLLANFNDTTKLYPNYPNKGNTVQAELNLFPCAYYLDVNGDSKKDLIATPNTMGSENTKSVWLYKNTSTTGTVNFQFVKNNFLQDEMIEVGQNSFPILFDYNGDGKKDLLIGNFGYYNGNTLNSRLTLYKNIGTSLSQPSFSLITRDYLSLSTRSLSNGIPMNNVMPTVGDIDGDLDLDLLIGTSTGQVHCFENTAGAGNPCNFSIFKENPFSFTTASGVAAPQLFDLDGDNKLDLLIGTKNGRISWYKNIGTQTIPTFSLITNFLGNVDVKGNLNYFGYDGYAAPYFFREGGQTKLLVGSVSGRIFYYSVPAVVTLPFSLISPGVNGYNEGGQSTVCYDDINNDGKPDLFIGNAGGGLSFCSSRSVLVGIETLTPERLEGLVNFFPNPVSEMLSVDVKVEDARNIKMRILDLLGKEIRMQEMSSPSGSVNVSDLAKGVYFVSIEFDAHAQNYRLIRKVIKD